MNPCAASKQQKLFNLLSGIQHAECWLDATGKMRCYKYKRKGIRYLKI